MPGTLTEAFSKARDDVEYDWAQNGMPPSCHEQRSFVSIPLNRTIHF